MKEIYRAIKKKFYDAGFKITNENVKEIIKLDKEYQNLGKGSDFIEMFIRFMVDFSKKELERLYHGTSKIKNPIGVLNYQKKKEDN